MSDAAIEQVLRQGAGSARDALSALELVASIGDEGVETVALDEFVEAMIDRDPGRALTMVAHAISIGRDPRTLAEELIGFMRNEFLCLMAPELVPVSGQHIDVLTDQAGRLGPPGLVRGIETLGAALSDMRHAPDARVLLDVAAVQLTADSVAPDLGALLSRLHRLEEQVAAGVAAAPASGAMTAPPVAVDPGTGRAALGGRARATAASESTSAAATTGAAVASPAAAPADTEASSDASPVVTELTTERWEQTVRPALRGMTRAVYAPATLIASDGDTATFSLPNGVHREKCEQHREAVEAAIRAVTGSAVSVQLLVEGETAAAPSAPSDAAGPSSTTSGPADPEAAGEPPPDVDEPPTPPAAGAASPTVAPTVVAPTPAPTVPAPIDDLPDDDDVDLDDLVDAPPESVKSPIDRLAEAFPGSELIDERT